MGVREPEEQAVRGPLGGRAAQDARDAAPDGDVLGRIEERVQELSGGLGGGPSQRASRALVLRISCLSASRSPAIGGRFSICGSIGGSWAAAAGARIRNARIADRDRTLFIVRDFHLIPTACQGTPPRQAGMISRSA